MMKRASLFLLLCLFALPVNAQQPNGIVIDLAEERVDIESDFSGKKIVVFGTAQQQGDIVIVVKGPESRITMRQRMSVFGIWLNRNAVDFKRVPLYYDYAVTRAESMITDYMTLRTYTIGLNNFTFNAARYDDKDNLPEFQEALIRTRQAKGFYPLEPQPISFIGPKLFRTSFSLPSDVPVGRYSVNAYLFNNGRVTATYNRDLQIAQAGLSASILNFAAGHGIAYAMTGLLIALLAGFATYWVSRYERI